MQSFIIKTANEQGFDLRSSATMVYTHALVSPEGWAFSWHTSAELARKASLSSYVSGYGLSVQAVDEVRKGSKATVIKQLQKEAAAAAAPVSEEDAIKALREKGKAAAKKTPSASRQAIEAKVAADADAEAELPELPKTKADLVLFIIERDDSGAIVSAEYPIAKLRDWAKRLQASPKIVRKAPRTLAATEGTMVCRSCSEEKALTSFPTKAPNKAGEVLRDDRCRACRSTEREAAKAAKAAPAKKATGRKASAKK